MRISITLTDDRGQTFEGEVDLTPATKPRRAATRAKPAPATDARLDFGLPRRAFLKKYATGGGPAKFVVLLAHLTGGKTGLEVARDAVEKAWAQNKGVLGGDYQTMYPTRAREKSWADSPKRGIFVLRPEWRGALRK
jgi:hypothetical protein